MNKNSASSNVFFLSKMNDLFRPVNYPFSLISNQMSMFKPSVIGRKAVFIILTVLLVLIEVTVRSLGIDYLDFKWFIIQHSFDLVFFYFIAFRSLARLIAGGKTKLLPLCFAAVVTIAIYVCLSLLFSELIALCLQDQKMIVLDSLSLQSSLIKGILLCLLAFVTAYARYTRSLESINREQKKQLRQLENSMLLFQTDPHLINNVFTHLYERIQHSSQEAAQSIALLAEITSNALMETDEKGYITLEGEIDYLKKYIQLESLYKEKEPFGNLHIDIQGYEKIKLPPKILLEPLVNLMKYGDFKNTESFPIVSLKIVDGVLQFRTFNAKKSAHKASSHKIGLKNLKQRLELNYPDQYALEVLNRKDFFELSLTIKLC
jgi:sensor histidine kinase YesM